MNTAVINKSHDEFLWLISSNKIENEMGVVSKCRKQQRLPKGPKHCYKIPLPGAVLSSAPICL